MQEKYLEYRKKYPVFYYESYNIDQQEDKVIISYHFKIDGLSEFSPKWSFKLPENSNFDTKDEIINNIVFNIGMVEVISYLKATCSPKLVVKCGYLNSDQIAFYKKLYFNGLGEFFYRNSIATTIDDFLEIESTYNKPFLSQELNNLNGNLILIGGGKDSLVSLDLLGSDKTNNKCYILNPRDSWVDGVILSGYTQKDIFSMKRLIDPNLIELNKNGYLKGHTPLSALLAVSSLLPAYILNKKNICVSNESSANEPTVKNTKINHQYSKSFEFETDFRNYCKQFISPSFNYFSVLRPLSEYQIAKYFSKLVHLHNVFHSCNLGSKTDVWCHECPKCLFIYLLLSPFLSQQKLKEIFGVNMLEDVKNLPEFEKLIGVTDEKSFECVGSRSEINFAIKKAIEQIPEDDLPILLQTYKEKYMKLDNSNINFDEYFDGNNYVSDEIIKLLKDRVIENDNR